MSASDETRRSWFAQHRGKLLVSLVVGGAFVWILRAGALPIVPQSFDGIRWWTVPAYLAIWSVVHAIRAARWSFLLIPLHPVPMRRLLAVSVIGFAAIQLLPFRMGEAVRPVLIRKKGHLSGWAATGTIGAERIIDGLFLSAMLLVALQLATPLSPLPDRIGDLPIPVSLVPTGAYYALALFGCAFVAMGVFYWRREWARTTTAKIIGLVSPRLATWLSDRVERVADGLRFLPDFRFSLAFVASTAAYWLINSAATWLLAWGVGFEDFSYAQACVTTGVLALGILVPNAPGFFGAYQLSLYASFAMFYSAKWVVGPGAANVFLVYLLQLAITFGAATIAMLAERTTVSEALDALD